MLRAMAARPEPSSRCALVLAGGGARGAYEMGALAELLPALPEDERPSILIGTSAGALNTAWLAANAHRPLGHSLADGEQIWREMSWDTVLASLTSRQEARLGVASVLDVFGFGAAGWSALDPSPLRRTLTEGPLSSATAGGIDFAQIDANARAGLVRPAVVATRAASSLSVVFYDGDGKAPEDDPLRGVTYAKTPLDVDHVLASAAIPSAFPAVRVDRPAGFEDWYYDGGTRLNAPIQPAIELGARRLIIVALNSPALGDVPAPGSSTRPRIFDGASSLVQAVLVDPLINDLHSLARINEDVAHAPGRLKIPYILIAPRNRDAIGRIAAEVFEKEHGGPRRRPLNWLWRLNPAMGAVARIGHTLDVIGSPTRGELLSYLFFDPVFAQRLIEQGRCDARAWLDEAHDDGMWQTGPLSAAAAGAAVPA
jgi:NTE family protein